MTSSKGQVFIFAALIIATALFSLIALYNSAKTYEDFSDAESLVDNFHEEIRNVIDSAVYNNQDVNAKIEQFIVDFKAFTSSRGREFTIEFQYNNYTYPTGNVLVQDPQESRFYYRLSTESGGEMFVKQNY